MYIKNPLNFVEWDKKSFLTVLFSIHIAMLGLIGLDLINFNIPILRQFFGFIYLTFVPGVLLLRLLRLKLLSLVEKSMFTISLSLITLMLSGVIINELGIFIIQKPISTIPLFFMIFIIVTTLLIICYIREKDTIYNHSCNNNSFITFDYNSSRLMIYLILVLFSTFLGTYLVNYYHSNILLLFTTLLITSLIFLVFFEKFVPETMYPLVIFVISISLLYHNSLISSTIWGFDIHQEYYTSNVVKTLGIWNHDIPTNINAMLSIVMIAPIYSDICNISLTYVFKIVYPFLFSFTPLGMYLIYKKQINNPKIAFFSIFYFMSVYPYYTDMLALARQAIAELFLVLIVLVMISDYELHKKKLLYTLFSFGLATSHYGLSYLFIFLSFIGFILLIYLHQESKIFNSRTVLLFILFAISWYMFVSSGSVFNTVINLLENIYNTFYREIFHTSAVTLATKTSPSLCGKLLRLSYFSSLFFIFIGFIQSFIAYKKSNAQSEFHFSKEYIGFSLASICSILVFLITSSTGMNIYRLYHISMIFLSLYFTIGGIFILNLAGKTVKNIVPAFQTADKLKFLSIFLALFILLNIGFIQEIVNDYPTSVSLSQESMKSGGPDSSMLLYRYYIPIQDVYGSTWLSKHRNDAMDIYADETAVKFVLSSYGMTPNQKYLYDEKSDYINSYIYFRYPNVVYNRISKKDSDMYEYEDISDLSSVTYQKYTIYSSGYNAIYT